MTIDLDGAVKAHADWKIKLRMAITKRERLDVATVSRDNICPLGQWLHGEGRQRHAALPSFGKAVQQHALFHLTVGKVAVEINSGHYDQAEQLIGPGSEFATCSTEVASSLMALRREQGQG